MGADGAPARARATGGDGGSAVPVRARTVFRAVAFAALALALGACVTPSSLESARSQLRSGDAATALATLEHAEVPRRDRLLLHLDRGLAAHAAGRYRESVEALSTAAELVERLDFVSVSEQGAALLVNDRVTSYRGESSERLWIHTFQMLNFLALDEPEGAAVEARRALAALEGHERALAADPVTRLLVAMSLEAAGQPDAASVEYRRLAADEDAPTAILRAAWLNARRTAQPEESARLAERLPRTTLESVRRELDGRLGELVVVVATGFVPRKRPGDLFVAPDLRISFPRYAEDAYTDRPVAVEARVDGVPREASTITTSLGEVARAALAERGRSIAARQLGRTAAKYNLADVAAERDALAGELLRWIFFALEQADTRGWETLPARLSLVQIPLAPGRHDVELFVRDGARRYRSTLENVVVRPLTRTFRSVRPGVGTTRYPLAASG